MKIYEQTPIHSWAVEDQPREKMKNKGMEALTNKELLSILLRSGPVGLTALDVAGNLMDKFGGIERLSRASFKELISIHGIGEVKALILMATFELTRRKLVEKHEILNVSHSRSVADYIRPKIAHLPQEVFYLLLLNARFQVLGEKIVSMGGVSSTMIDPKIIFKEAIDHLACSIIVAHNHPSGNLSPSKGDEGVTNKLIAGGKALGIRLIDHLIVTERGHYSFADAGMIPFARDPISVLMGR